MKKICTFLALVSFGVNTGSAQDKAIKFGLKITPGVNIYIPDDPKDMAKDGGVLNFAWGGAVEFSLGENVAIVTGLEVLTSGGKIQYLDTAGYAFSDGDVLEINKDGSFTDDISGLSLNYYLLNTRRFRANYVNLPVALKAKTNEIGYLTYFGQFGLTTSINTRGRANDNITDMATGNTLDQSDLSIDNEVAPVKFVLNVGGGAEYNLSGSTSLVLSAHYNHGFTNVIKGTSKHLIDKNGAAFEQKVFERGFSLSAGILF